MTRCLSVALLLFFAASNASADFFFNIGGGQSFTGNSGVVDIPIYVGTNANDQFTAVEFFFSHPTLIGGTTAGDIIGTASGPSMVGNSQLQPGPGNSVVQLFDRSLNVARFNAAYSSPVTVPSITDPLSSRIIGTLQVNTNGLGLGTYTFTSEFVNVLNGGNSVASQLSGSFTIGSIAAVPEPATMGLLGLAMVGGIGTARRRWKRAVAA